MSNAEGEEHGYALTYQQQLQQQQQQQHQHQQALMHSQPPQAQPHQPALRSPHLGHQGQEERDRRALQEILGQEKSLLRACEVLQRQADALAAALAEQRRAKKRLDTPLLEAKAEELELKRRLLAENAQTLRTLRSLRCQLEVALSGKRLQAIVSSTQERVLEASGRDPAQALRDISAEEQVLQNQERDLEEALKDEMSKEEAGRQSKNEAGEWAVGKVFRAAAALAPRNQPQRAHPPHPIFTPPSLSYAQRSSRPGRRSPGSTSCWTRTGTACSSCGAPGQTFTRSARRTGPRAW